jgi:hypothetical protein
MPLKKQKYYFQYPPSPSITAGFTNPSLPGELPADIQTIFPGKQAAFMRQTHGNKILKVVKNGIYDCDGLVTTEKDLVIAVKTADCLPLTLYNEKENTAAVVHMGWRSAARNILSALNTDLSDYIAIAGPGLRKCCYNVGEDLTEYTEIKPFITRSGKHLHFDPVLYARSKLITLGLKEKNFLDTGICSFCSGFGLPSYRRTKTSNRTLSFIVISGKSNT